MQQPPPGAIRRAAIDQTTPLWPRSRRLDDASVIVFPPERSPATGTPSLLVLAQSDPLPGAGAAGPVSTAVGDPHWVTDGVSAPGTLDAGIATVACGACAGSR